LLNITGSPVNPPTPAPLPWPGANASQCAPQVSPNRSKPQRMTPSANPMPFKPSMERQRALPPRPTPVNPTQCGHPGRLIVEFKPKLPVEKQVQGWFLREKINLSLEMEEAPENICVAGISWSHTGNPIVIAADGCSAVDLVTYEDTIVNALIGNTEGEFLTDAHPDVEYHKVKLNGVPTQSFSSSGEPYDAEDVMEEFAEQCVAYRLMGQYAKPIWLGSAGTENRKTMGMVVFSFANAEDARTLLNIRQVFIFGEACTITRYEDWPRYGTARNVGPLATALQPAGMATGVRPVRPPQPTTTHTITQWGSRPSVLTATGITPLLTKIAPCVSAKKVVQHQVPPKPQEVDQSQGKAKKLQKQKVKGPCAHQLIEPCKKAQVRQQCPLTQPPRDRHSRQA
ncbi:hypothetical protein BS47DRAFT_1434257, partial [Hydnum rufescens UP504]